MKSKTRIIGISALGLLTVVIAILGWGVYSFEHMRISFTAAQLQDMQTALKGEVGKAIFQGVRPAGHATEGTGLSALLAPPKEPQGEGLIAAYQHDRETFRRYARLFDTAAHAERLANAVQHDRTAYKLPISSSAVRIERAETTDAWGHTYCISASKTSIAVVSGGPEVGSFSCSNQKTPAQEIASATRNIFQSSTGEVVVVLKQVAEDIPHR
jgi:hypothetical protein